MQSGFGWGKGRRVIVTTSHDEASVSIDTPRVRRAMAWMELNFGPLADYQAVHLRNVFNSLPPRVTDFSALNSRALIEAMEDATGGRQPLRLRMAKADLPEAR